MIRSVRPSRRAPISSTTACPTWQSGAFLHLLQRFEGAQPGLAVIDDGVRIGAAQLDARARELEGRREPGPAILEPFGLVRTVVIEKRVRCE